MRQPILAVLPYASLKSYMPPTGRGIAFTAYKAAFLRITEQGVPN